MMLLDLFLVLFFLQFSGGQSWPLMSGLLHLEGSERAATPPRLLLAVPNVTAHHQRPLYQLHYSISHSRVKATTDNYWET